MNPMPTKPPPPPMEWHPAYQDKPWLLEWLNSDQPHVVLPVLPPSRSWKSEHTAGRTMTLTKHQAAALAPYTGHPYHLVWYVATDNLGRSIAGERRYQYEDRLDTSAF